MEAIEAHNGSAFPAEIHRSSGVFILLLVNRTHDPAATFLVDPAAIGDGVVGPNPLRADHANESIQRAPIPGRGDPASCALVPKIYPLTYEHVAELVAERGLQVEASCI